MLRKFLYTWHFGRGVTFSLSLIYVKACTQQPLPLSSYLFLSFFFLKKRKPKKKLTSLSYSYLLPFHTHSSLLPYSLNFILLNFTHPTPCTIPTPLCKTKTHTSPFLPLYFLFFFPPLTRTTPHLTLSP